MSITAPTAREIEAQARFDARVYALPVIKKASYRFLKTFVANITQDGDEWVCDLQFQAPVDAAAIEVAIRELRAEVLDQDLREVVSRETEQVRNTILAVAFSKTGLQRGE